MTDFHHVKGFQDRWRFSSPARIRPGRALLSPSSQSPKTLSTSRLRRVVANTPEVVIRLTGRIKTERAMSRHLSYITRGGEHQLQDRDGNTVHGPDELKALAQDWWTIALLKDPGRRDKPILCHTMILSMPPGSQPGHLSAAARDFAQSQFASGFDFVHATHDDTRHPHVHLAVRGISDDGQRLDPYRADLQHWREKFAEALRDRGVEAEATPRSLRGAMRASEHIALRKIRDLHEAGLGPPSRVSQSMAKETTRTGWDERIARQQETVRALYMSEAAKLLASPTPADQALGEQVLRFVVSMSEPETPQRRLDRRTLLDQIERKSYPEQDRAR